MDEGKGAEPAKKSEPAKKAEPAKKTAPTKKSESAARKRQRYSFSTLPEKIRPRLFDSRQSPRYRGTILLAWEARAR